MPTLDDPFPPVHRHAAAPHLCGSVQGIEFWIESPRGKPLRRVITEAALQARFGAAETEQSWLEAYEQHRVEIEGRARRALASQEDVYVVLLTDPEGRLKTAVGRCST